MDRDIDREDESEEAPAAGQQFRAKLKVVAHYALLTSPVLAFLALVLAGAALILGRSAPPAVDSSARIESLSASLTETKNELESLKFTLARERSQRAEERKKAEEREAAIIQHVSRLQSKSKVSPTLEEQLKETTRAAAPAASGVPAAAAGTTAAAVTTAPAVTEAKPAVAPTATVADKAHSTPKTVEKKPAATAPPATGQTPAQLKALKDAIDKLNKK